MISRLREKKIYCGNHFEVEIYPVFPTSKSRGRKNKPTSEVQKELNRRNAEKKLIRLINTNFRSDDIEIGLDYDDFYLPQSEDEWKKDVSNYIRRVKNYIKQNNLPELKYVVVFEYGEKTNRMHTHVIMNRGINRDTLEILWGKGRANTKRLQPDNFGLTAIAAYISKHPMGSKRWNASKNLKKPVIKANDYKITKKIAKEMSENRQSREIFEKLYPGYFFNKCTVFYNDVNGGTYFEIDMIKKENKNAVQTKTRARTA